MSTSGIDFGLQAERLRARSAEIVEEDGMLTETVNALLNEMQLLLQDHEHKELAYVQQKDLRNLAIFENMTVIAVRAPPGTRMEVPDPILTPGNPSFQVYLRSESGPVNFYLVSKAQDVQPTSSSLSAAVPEDLSRTGNTSTARAAYVAPSSMVGTNLGGPMSGGMSAEAPTKTAESWASGGATSSEWIGRRGIDSHEGEGDVFEGGSNSSTANVSPMAVYPSALPSVPVLASDEDFGGSRKRKRAEEDIAGPQMMGASANASHVPPSHLLHHHLGHDVGSYTLGQLGIDDSGFGDATGAQQYLNIGVATGPGVGDATGAHQYLNIGVAAGPGVGQSFGTALQYSGGGMNHLLGFPPRQESRTSVNVSDGGWQSTKASRASQNEDSQDLMISGMQQSGGKEEELQSQGVISRLV